MKNMKLEEDSNGNLVPTSPQEEPKQEPKEKKNVDKSPKKININKKQASKAQVETLLKYSETRNSPAEHYQIMCMVTEMSASVASYEIERLKDLKVLPKWDFVTNMKITRDPNYYTTQVKKNEQAANEASYAYRLKEYMQAMADKNANTAAIIYLELKNVKEFEEDVKMSENLKASFEKMIAALPIPKEHRAWLEANDKVLL